MTVKFITTHSMVDTITNSSSEIYIVEGTYENEFVQELFNFIVKNGGGNYSSISKFTEWRYADEYIVPEHLDTKTLYAIDLEYREKLLEKIVSEYFTVVELEYKDE